MDGAGETVLDRCRAAIGVASFDGMEHLLERTERNRRRIIAEELTGRGLAEGARLALIGNARRHDVCEGCLFAATSTLRFCARPVAVSLPASGLGDAPKPFVVEAVCGDSGIRQIRLHRSARRCESGRFCASPPLKKSVCPSIVSFQSGFALSMAAILSIVGFDSSRITWSWCRS